MMSYLRVLLNWDEYSFRKFNVFVADDIQVLFNFTVFPQFISLKLFNFCKEKNGANVTKEQCFD